jgi:hypothetical protein
VDSGSVSIPQLSFYSKRTKPVSALGAKARYMHKHRRTKEGNPAIAKTPIQGVLERASEANSSRMKLRVLKTTRKTELQSMCAKSSKKAAKI